MAAPTATSQQPDGSAPSRLEECVRSLGPAAAWNTLDQMRRQGHPVTRFTLSRLLMKTVADGRGPANRATLYRGIEAVEQFMLDHPNEADEVLFNALLDACYHVKDLARLEAALRRMDELKVEPSHVTLGILVKAFGQAGDAARVVSLWDKMVDQRDQANAVTHGCMIDACVRCGRQKKAMEIFQDMKRRKKHRNTILYTTLIKGCGMERDLRTALALFREMKCERVPYNRITYNSIIDVCIKCNDVQAAENLFGEMTAPGSKAEPDLITFSTLLKGYCHTGDLDKALQVAENLKSGGLRCDELVYNTLMDGCVRANDLSAGIGLLAEMVRSGLTPSPITHSILVRLYQKAGSCSFAGAADAVGRLYEHHGLLRPSAPPERRGRGRRGRGHHASVEKPRHAAGATSRVCLSPPPAPPAAPAAHPAALQLVQLPGTPAPQQPQAHFPGHRLGVQQTHPGLDGATMRPPTSVGHGCASADISGAMQAAQAQAARAQAAQVQAAQAQEVLAAYKSLGLTQALEVQQNSCSAPDAPCSKEGAGGPPAPYSGQSFPNLLQHAARGPVPVALQADPGAGQFSSGSGVYGDFFAPVSPILHFGGS